MIRQPWGCLLTVFLLLLSVGICLALGWLALLAFELNEQVQAALIVFCIVLALPVFIMLMDLGHKMEIRLFCKRHDLHIIRIKTYRNHFGVEYLEHDQKKYGRWPKDFEIYQSGR